MTWIEIAGVVLGSGAFSSVVTWLTSRAMRSAEVKKSNAQAADFLAQAYSQLIADLHKEVDHLRKVNKEVTESYDRLTEKFRQAETEVDELRKSVIKLTNRLKQYEAEDKKTIPGNRDSEGTEGGRGNSTGRAASA